MLFAWENRESSERARSFAALACLVSLGVVACGPADQNPANGGSGSSGMAGSSNNGTGGITTATGGMLGASGSNTSGHGGSAGLPGGGMAGSLATGGASSSGGTASSGGAPPGGGAGSVGTMGGSAGSGGTGNGGTAGSGSGSSTGGAHTRDHCVDGYDADPSDATMKSADPVSFMKGNQVDTTVQPEVISWMQAHVWESAHFQWHNIRRCSGGMVETVKGGGINPCKNTDLVPKDQEGKTPGDGLQFFAMHRHMIQSLKQLFPKHAAQFEGWEHFPTNTADVPEQWKDVALTWPSNIASAAQKADDPAAAMAQNPSDPIFASEGAFGQWIQTTSGLHGALHFKWVRTANDEHGLGNQFTNIDNYMFWKMHGWIDKVWDRYRAAKGMKPADQDIKDAVLAQCRQMDQLALLIKPDLNPGGNTCTTPAPKQTGVFAEKIRPMFENPAYKCTGCHGSGAQGNLTLGGNDCLKSSDIVAAIVGKQSTTGGQFKLIQPGDPDKSWFYRKIAGTAASAGCTATGSVDCRTDNMPQGGELMSAADLQIIRDWITAGAPAPQ